MTDKKIKITKDDFEIFDEVWSDEVYSSETNSLVSLTGLDKNIVQKIKDNYNKYRGKFIS